MEIKLLYFVLSVSLSFAQAIGQDDGRSCNGTILYNQSLSFNINSGKCHPNIDKDRLTFINCGDDDIKFVAEIVAKAKDVVIIDISHSGLQSIDAIDFQQNGQLKKLIASDNKLQVFPTKCVSTASAIEEINLSANQLSAITLNDFKGIDTVATIDLSSNAIVSIEKYSFILLNHLQHVNLRNNHIRALQQIDFCSDCVVSVHFEGNPMKKLNAFDFPIVTNTLVHASWATIDEIDLQGHSSRFRVILDDKNEAIFGKTFKNSQYAIHCGDESFVQTRSLAIAKYQVDNVPSLLQCLGSSIHTLILTANYLGSLNRTTFQRFTKLQFLFVADTQLKEFDIHTIRTASDFQMLDISSNNFKYVSNVPALKEMQRLTRFRAAGNSIRNIPELIHYLPSYRLHELDLSGNYIGRLNKTTFKQFPDLFDLKLRNTEIFITDFNPFEQLQLVREFDISHNSLDGVRFTIIANTLWKLRVFYASYCQIRNISAVIQYLNGDIVEVLDFSGNIVNSLELNLFTSFSNLITLNLSSASIKHLAPHTVQYLHSIDKFDISNNQLHNLDWNLIPRGVQELHINSNRLHQIKNLNGERLPTLNKVDIANNCFTSDYVRHIKQKLSVIDYLGDPFKQKSHEECANYDEQAPKLNGNYTTTVIIVVISVAVIITIPCICLVYRKNLSEKLKMMHKRSQTTTEPNSNSNRSQSIKTTEMATMDEPIYEELDDHVRYDQLWHEFQPKPLSKETRETYDTTSNCNRSDGDKQ